MKRNDQLAFHHPDTVPLSINGYHGVPSLPDLAPYVICSIDREGRFLQVSAAARSVWGYEPPELQGLHWTDLVAVEDRPHTLQGFSPGTTIHNFTNHCRCKDGSLKPIIWSGRWDAGAQVAYYIAHDGTESEKAARREQHYQQRLYRAHKLARLGWWESDHKTLSISDELYEIYGLNKSELPGGFTMDTFLSLVHPDDLETVLRHWEAIPQFAYYQYEHRLVKPSGEVVYIQHLIQTITGKEGRVTGTHGTVQDITDFKQAERTSRAAQKKMEAVLESLGDGFYTLDHHWHITYWNRKAEEITGIPREQVLGTNAWNLYPESASPPLQKEFHRAADGGVPVHFEEYLPSLRKWLEFSVYPSGEGLSVYVRDSTEKRALLEERRLFDLQIQQARNNLLTVLESMSDGFFTVDSSWTITYATDRIAAMMSIQKEDYVGRNLWDCFAPHEYQRSYREYHRAFAENTLVTFEEFLPDFNVWVEISAYPAEGELAVYVKNITERKQQEKRLEFMAKATSEVIWERILDAEEVTINGDKLRQHFGHDIEGNCIQRSFWRALVHPDDTAALDEAHRQALEQGHEFYSCEYRFRKADNTWAYVKERTYVVRNEKGAPVALIGAIEDITAERMAEQALLDSEQSYRQLFDNAPLPKAIYDIETLRILDVNRTAVEHYGYSREEFLSMTALDIRPPEEHAKLFSALSGLELNTRRKAGIFAHRKKNGENIQVEVSLTTILYKGRKANLATMYDVTEKIRLQEQLVQEKVAFQKGITKAVIEAQESERSSIGRELHDNVNQVIASAKLYVENIRYYPEQSALFIDKSAALLNRSIEEIRKLSRALVTPVINDLGFRETVLEMADSYRSLHLFEVVCAFDFREGALHKELRLTLYRILQEAFNNTVKYAGASLVQVSLVQNDRQLHLAYTDDGVGFNPATVKKGMGLQNIRNRAGAYGGEIRIESSPGGGYRLEAAFPL